MALGELFCHSHKMQFHTNRQNSAIIWADNAAHSTSMGSEDSVLLHEQEMVHLENLLGHF